jgi:hypothetical protein
MIRPPVCNGCQGCFPQFHLILVRVNCTDGEAWNDLKRETKANASTPIAPTASTNTVPKSTNTFGNSTKTSAAPNKRKLVLDPASMEQGPKSAKQSKKEKKKEKDKKGLLSFGDEEEG